MFNYEVPNKAGMLEAAKQLQSEFSWIGKVLKTYLPKIKPHSLICCIPIGDAVELLHLRELVGPTVKIYGIDNQVSVSLGGVPDINKFAIVASGSYFIPGDIRYLDLILDKMQKTPDIVISRHPEIIEQIEISTGKILKQNDWWLEPLATLAEKVKKNGGTFLSTCYLKPERDLLAEALRSKGLKPELFENNFSPREYWAKAGNFTRKPDGFIVRV